MKLFNSICFLREGVRSSFKSTAVDLKYRDMVVGKFQRFSSRYAHSHKLTQLLELNQRTTLNNFNVKGKLKI